MEHVIAIDTIVLPKLLILCGENFACKEIKWDEKINLRSVVYKLIAIAFCSRSHYKAVAKFGSEWYVYDDIAERHGKKAFAIPSIAPDVINKHVGRNFGPRLFYYVRVSESSQLTPAELDSMRTEWSAVPQYFGETHADKVNRWL
jgi:hypothetical protein